MAAKLLQNLADDNPDLQKQIGCMTGIFQVFDHQQMVSGYRDGHRRLSPANRGFCNGGVDREYKDAYLRQHTDEGVYFANPSESLRFLTESSRASISSSCSSSLSSLECSRSAQPISSPFDRAVFLEAPSIDPIPRQLGSSSPHLGRKSMDLRNAVEDSMYREAGRVGLQVKHKKADGISCRDGLRDINSMPTDIKESLKVLANIWESPWYYNDVGKLPRSSSARDQSSQSLARDAPRLSCDGMEQMQNDTSFESQETVKSTTKLKELPRLSLDSREVSVQPLHSAVDSNLVQKNSEKVDEKRPPSILAKLMGLEPLPEPSSANDYATVALKKPELTEMSKQYELSSRTRGFEYLGSSMKEPESPRWRNPDGTMRPEPRIPNEPAPWRQSDGSQVLLKPGQKPVKVSAKTKESVPSVYGEIEKRLKDLEFKQSGKDLRALTQILEAIQAKGLLESKKEDQATNNGGNRNFLRPIPGTERQQVERGNHSIASGSRGSDNTRVFESPIVIMKSAKLVEQNGFVDTSSMIPIKDLSNLPEFQGGVPAETRKGVVADRRMDRDQTPKPIRKNSATTSDKKISSKNVKSNQIPSRPRSIMKENSTLPVPKNSSLASPRLPQKKLEPERQSHPPTPPSDANKSKRISNQQTSEAASSGGRHRIKYSNSNPSEDKMSEVSICSRTQSYQGDDISVHSDGSTFFSSKFDIEVSRRSSPARSVQFLESKSMSMDVSKPLVDEDEVFAELLTVATEHHSPVSVLDPSAHIEDDPTPVKITQNSLRESSALVLSHDYGEYILDAKMNTASTSSAPEIDRKKLQDIEKLVRKLRRVNSTHDEESTDYIASLCENFNPDHRYISEILLTSGLLLRDLGSGLATFQFHSSGQPINPELFFVLEQMKSSGTTGIVPTKVHRKLIFDSVNEILIEKLSGPGVLDEPWLMSVGNLARKMPTAQKLLKQLCTETELPDSKKPSSSSLDFPNKNNDGLKGIPWEDVVRRAGSWTDFRVETSSIVLGIERLIFKDLVNEILVGCGTGLSSKRLSRPRGFFSS